MRSGVGKQRTPEELEQLRQQLLSDHPNLGRTTWTWDQMQAAESAVDAHIDDCDACQEALEDEPPEDGSDYFCPLAESLLEYAAVVAIEYSWQPDFPPRDDPRWKELSERRGAI